MDKEQIFERLRKQSQASLLGVLLVAYDEMNEKQRLKIFGPFASRSKTLKPSKVEEALTNLREAVRLHLEPPTATVTPELHQ